jgi:ABC-2 type transport system permease protein
MRVPFSRELRMFPTMLKVGFANMAAYRAEVFIWILTTTMPLIMYAMWSTVAREAPIGRFDEATFASYFLCTLIVRQLSGAWVVWELNEMVRSGSLSMVLLKPAHPLFWLAAENLGAVPFRVLVLVPIAIVATWAIPGIHISHDPAMIGLAVWTLALSWLLTFLVQSSLGLIALYSQQSLSFQDAWFGLWAVFSGYLVPLELIPKIQSVANWLPFRSMGSLPTEIALGHLQGAALRQGLIAQMMWVAIVLLVIRLAWDRGMRRWEAFGA